MRNFPVLAVLLILIPVTEIFLFVQMGQAIGYFTTLVALVGMTLLGSYLLRRQGFVTLQNFLQGFATGRLPAFEAMEGMLVALSSLLLLIPGFLSDIIGLFFLIPWTRRWIIRIWLKRRHAGVETKIYPNSHTRIEPEQIVVKPQGQTHYDYEGEYVRKD